MFPSQKKVYNIFNSCILAAAAEIKRSGVVLTRKIFFDFSALFILFTNTVVSSRPNHRSKKIHNVVKSWLIAKTNETIENKIYFELNDSIHSYFSFIREKKEYSSISNFPVSCNLAKPFYNMLVSFCENHVIDNAETFIFLSDSLLNAVDEVERLFKCQNAVVRPFLYVHFIISDTKRVLSEIGSICEKSNILVRTVYWIILTIIFFAIMFAIYGFIIPILSIFYR